MHHQPLYSHINPSPKSRTSLSLSLISAGLEVRDQRERSWQFLRMCFSKMLLLQQTQIFFISHQCRIQYRIGSERSKREIMANFKNVFFKDVAAATNTDLLHQPSV
jgi:hypothetical protein